MSHFQAAISLPGCRPLLSAGCTGGVGPCQEGPGPRVAARICELGEAPEIGSCPLEPTTLLSSDLLGCPPRGCAGSEDTCILNVDIHCQTALRVWQRVLPGLLWPGRPPAPAGTTNKAGR